MQSSGEVEEWIDSFIKWNNWSITVSNLQVCVNRIKVTGPSTSDEGRREGGRGGERETELTLSGGQNIIHHARLQ